LVHQIKRIVVTARRSAGETTLAAVLACFSLPGSSSPSRWLAVMGATMEKSFASALPARIELNRQISAARAAPFASDFSDFVRRQLSCPCETAGFLFAALQRKPDQKLP